MVLYTAGSGDKPSVGFRRLLHNTGQLRTASKVSVERLKQLLSGKGRGMSEPEERALAGVLDVPRVELRPMSFAGCSGELETDE